MTFSPGGKLLVLRFSRLGRTPPALYGTQLLHEAGLPVLVVEYGELREPQRWIDGKPPRVRLQNPWAGFVPRFARGAAILLGTFLQLLTGIARGGRPRFVFAHGLGEQVLARALSLLVRVPYAVHVHESYEDSDLSGFNRVLLRLEGWAIRGAKFLIFPEATRAQIYQKRYGLKNPIHVVFNCPRKLPKVAPRDLRAQFKLPADSFLIGYVGGVGPANALEEAIDALRRAPGAYLILWGWVERDFRDHLLLSAESLGVEGRVIFAGELEAGKWEVLAGLDLSYCVYRPIWLRLRHGATASNKLMESLAVGVPVLTSGEADFRAVVEGRGVGLCLKGYTAADIAEGFASAKAQPERRAKWAQNGRAAHLKDLNYESQFAGVLEEFLRCFKSK